jgi:CheY-like chemotaxis protein
MNLNLKIASNMGVKLALTQTLSGLKDTCYLNLRQKIQADDNSDIRELITLHLLKWGAEVKQVKDGVEILQAAQSESYDIIFVDMEMPLMDGLTAVKFLRAKGYEGVIYSLTANETDYYVELSRIAGCNGHLTKPVNIEVLRDVVIKLD